jgi:hypothetical protein
VNAGGGSPKADGAGAVDTGWGLGDRLGRIRTPGGVRHRGRGRHDGARAPQGAGAIDAGWGLGDRLGRIRTPGGVRHRGQGRHDGARAPQRVGAARPPASSVNGPQRLSPFWLTPPRHLLFCTRAVGARCRRNVPTGGRRRFIRSAAAASLLRRCGVSGIKGTEEPWPEVERPEKNTLSQGSLSSRFCRHVVHGRR